MSDVVSEPLPAYPSPELIEYPYQYFERMRTEAPVFQSPDNGEFLVFRHDDITHVLKRHDVFSEDIGPTSFDRGSETMISSRAGDDHRRTRHLAYRPVTSGRMRDIEPKLVKIADELIDKFIDAGQSDFMTQYALPIPGLLMCDLMGLSTEGEEGRIILGHWADLVDYGDARAAEDAPAYSMDTLLEFFDRKLHERVEQPGDDMLSDYIRLQTERDGGPDFDYLTVIATEMLVGGAGTTALMMTNALWLLLTHPNELARVRENPALIPAVLEESLRVESVVQERERVALVDTELSGVKIPAGSRVRLVLAAANRDPEVFPEPERFDVDRSPRKIKQHFGFGRGIHTCVGAPLARLEGKVALERILARTKDLQLSERNDFAHVYSTHFRSFKALWVDFDPAA